MSQRVDETLDCKGLACPMPVVKTKKAIGNLKPGQVLKVEATDRGSLADLKAWSERSGHQYIGSKEEDGVFHHFIRKATEGEYREEHSFPHVVDLKELENRHSDPELTVLDVREPMEYDFGHIPGAKHISLGELEERLSELDPKKEIWVICRSGSRSDLACQKLHEKGFNVKNVVPGMKDWQGPTEQNG
jgi:rhodanese-related sulfurtransferase/TusA-related sulfurtransferase